METGITPTPSTIRRNVPYSQIGKLPNLFPIIRLPIHRLQNVYTLGACHHEVSHNLQADLGLWQAVPVKIFKRLTAERLPRSVALTYTQWQKEVFADVVGVMLGGPALIPSLMDVIASPLNSIQHFNPRGVHPTPYLRLLLNLEVLRRLGFEREAAAYRRLWDAMYPPGSITAIPKELLETFPVAGPLVIDTICFQPYPQLGNHSMAEVVPFRPSHQAMIEEAGRRLAKGIDPGIIPERFLVGAARFALEQKLAAPDIINRNFYQAIGTH
jgi:hypothetical protein